MKDFYAINAATRRPVGTLPAIPESLLQNLKPHEAIIWLPEDLSRDSLRTDFPALHILDNGLVSTDNIEKGMWIRTSIQNEPSFLELSAKEFDYITRKMGVTPFSLEVYLYIQDFCKRTFGDYIDREYWTWLPKTRFDRSGLLVGGIDKLGQFDFHGWMPDFQATFCGGRYYYTAEGTRESVSRITLEWEYDKRETSFKHWSGKLQKGDAESAFAAYHLLRDFELMKLYLRMFEEERRSAPADLIELHARWTERLAKENREKLFELAVEQVGYYHVMLNDLVGYILSGITASDSFVPYRVANGLKNLRNFYLVVNLLATNDRVELIDLRNKLAGVIRKIRDEADKKLGSNATDEAHFYFDSLGL